MPHTSLKCLNANFIYYGTHLLEREGGAFFIYSEFVLFLFLQLYFFNCLQFYLLDHSTTSRGGIRFQRKAFHILPKVAFIQDSQHHAIFLFYLFRISFYCDDLHLQIIGSISPKSICREFISPVDHLKKI